MYTDIQILGSKSNDVWKYLFIKNDAIAESVLYKYNTFEDRTVICCSVMSGCPVGCIFCGTGKYFVRNLTSEEIIYQIRYIIENINVDTPKIKKFQIMFMSMGEPMLNWINVKKAIVNLNKVYPNSQLLLSTVGINDSTILKDILSISKKISSIGLQFSIHASTDEKRNTIIPYTNKLCLTDIRDFGITWHNHSHRKSYINYIVMSNNTKDTDIENLKRLFSKDQFNFTFSVLCSVNKNKDIDQRTSDLTRITSVFKKADYNVRQFNPAGQDDIGGGCGQLWFVQKWMKKQHTLQIKEK